MKNDDYRICDKCYWFTVHPSGLTENCSQERLDPYVMRKYYTEERINGEKTSCKGYKPVPQDMVATFGGVPVSNKDVKTLIKHHNNQ